FDPGREHPYPGEPQLADGALEEERLRPPRLDEIPFRADSAKNERQGGEPASGPEIAPTLEVERFHPTGELDRGQQVGFDQPLLVILRDQVGNTAVPLDEQLRVATEPLQR